MARLAGKRHHAAVMIAVAFAVEQIHAGNFAHRGHDRIHLRCVAPFGKIRNTFNESFHQLEVLHVQDGAAFHREAAKIHTKIIRDFAIVGHVKRSHVRIFANLKRPHAVMYAQ